MLFSKRSISILLCGCFFFCTLRTAAQKLVFKELGVEDGLLSSEVYNLYQDPQGYVWAFTEFGIVKHNGSRFIPVCKNLPFEESAVYAVCESPQKVLYFANSKAHIYEVRNDSAFLVRGIEKLSYSIIRNNETMYTMHVDDSANIYFSTFYHSYELEHRSGRLISLTDQYYSGDSLGIVYKNTGNGFAYVRTLAHYSSSTSLIWIRDKNDRTVLRTSYPLLQLGRPHLLERDGVYYLLLDHTLRAIDRQGNKQDVELNDFSVNMKIAPNGHIWVATKKGLSEYDRELRLLNNYFPSLIISDILFDDQGGMWVSSIEKGVYYCKNIYMDHYDNIPDLGAKIMLVKKIGGRLFIGSGNGKLYVKENETLRLLKMGGDDVRYVNDIVFYNNRYVVGTKYGTVCLDKDLNPLPDDPAFHNTRDSVKGTSYSAYAYAVYKDTLCFVNASEIITKYKDEQCIWANMNHSLFKTRSIISTADGLYVGTNKGLYLFNGRAEVPHYLDFFSTKTIDQLRKDRKGTVWICSRGAGLFELLPDHRLIRINVPSNIVQDIGFTGDSTYLLSTNKGLYYATSANLAQHAPWRQLYDREVFHCEAYGDALYLATSEGLIAMNKSALWPKAPAPLYLESFLVNNHKMSSSNIKLNYRQNDLHFNFDILRYDEEQLCFSYRLDGPDPDKGKVTGTQLHLQNLSPGYYRLYVYLTGQDNKPESTCIIPFYIEPAFWQVRFFIIEATVTCIALCILFTGVFYDRLKKKQLQKTMFTRLLIEQRLTALKAQINPHFISNTLTGVQQLIIENTIDKANQYIAKFSLLIRYILNYSDKPAALLSNELEIIELIVELEKLRFSNKFVFEKQVGPGVHPHELYIPPLITQPLIENAIWHGLLPLNDHRAPTLTLKLALRDEKLVISIIDNGVGRSKAAPGLSNNHESRGVWLTLNRIGNLNRLYPNHKSDFTFTDLYSPDGKPAGTQVDLVFPLIVLEQLIYDDTHEDLDY